MNIPFGPDFFERYMKALERQKRRERERPGIDNLDPKKIKSDPKFLKFLEEQGLTLDENGNLVKKE